MATPIPLIGAAQQPAYPQVNLNVVPQGLIVSIQLGPTTVIQQVIESGAMDQVVKLWRDQRKNVDHVLRAVQETKL